MNFDESDIKKYIRTYEGFNVQKFNGVSYVGASVETLVDMANFFVKLQEKKKWEKLYNDLTMKNKGLV